MKSIRWMLPLLGSLLMAATASAQNAGEIQFASRVQMQDERIAELEARLASMEATEVSFGIGAAQTGDCGKCGKGGKGGGCWCSPGGGYVAEGELLMLMMRESFGDLEQNALHSASRWTFGYMDDCGRSLRARWFEFASVAEDGAEVQMENVDVEYAGRFTWGCNWRGELSVGARWASFFEGDTNTRIIDSYGPVAGIEVRTDLLSCLDLYVGARHAYLIGFDVENGVEGVAYASSEMRFGVEAQRCTAYGDVFLRTGLEGQYHHSIWDGSGDLALLGYTLSLGLNR